MVKLGGKSEAMSKTRGIFSYLAFCEYKESVVVEFKDTVSFCNSEIRFFDVSYNFFKRILPLTDLPVVRTVIGLSGGSRKWVRYEFSDRFDAW
jgi:hypothetical protein